MKKYLHKEPFYLENGKSLRGLEVAYHTVGNLQPEGQNVIWICHALTANSDVSDWWAGLVGEGKLFDTSKYFVVCANVLGSCYGTTGPLSTDASTGEPYYHSFPHITVRDMVQAHIALRKHLGIEKIALLIGGSLGGYQAQEWAVEEKSVIERLVLLATAAKHSPWGIAFNEAQRLAIAADTSWREKHHNAGKDGLKAARAVALLSYRNNRAYNTSQQEEDLSKTDDFKAASYQNYQGKKLVDRFNAFSYWTLSKAMDSHNIGRGRGGIEQALKSITAQTVVIGISSDILFPIQEQTLLARYIPNATLDVIHSIYGHDGFLIETKQIAAALRKIVRSITPQESWLYNR